MKKTLVFAMIVPMLMAGFSPVSFAAGGKEALASLALPTTGQAMNNELGATKTKLMGGIEVAAIATTAILGISTGGASVLIGVLPLAANHLWSSVDAYKGAKKQQQDPYLQQQMMEAQRTIDLSRQRRFDREQDVQTDVYDKVKRAGEQY